MPTGSSVVTSEDVSPGEELSEEGEGSEVELDWLLVEVLEVSLLFESLFDVRSRSVVSGASVLSVKSKSSESSMPSPTVTVQAVERENARVAPAIRVQVVFISLQAPLSETSSAPTGE